MKELTATALRKNLFHVLEQSSKAMPTKILYKKGDNIIVSYQSYLNLKKKKKKGRSKLTPLVKGKVGILNEESEEELLAYMGIR